jgi:hypothetical protein
MDAVKVIFRLVLIDFFKEKFTFNQKYIIILLYTTMLYSKYQVLVAENNQRASSSVAFGAMFQHNALVLKTPLSSRRRTIGRIYHSLQWEEHVFYFPVFTGVRRAKNWFRFPITTN